MLSCFAVCFSAVPFALEVFNDVVLAPVRNLKLTYTDITFWRWRSLRPSWAQLNLALVTWQDIAVHWCRLWINGRIQPKETTLKWILCRPCKQPVDVVLKTQMMVALWFSCHWGPGHTWVNVRERGTESEHAISDSRRASAARWLFSKFCKNRNFLEANLKFHFWCFPLFSCHLTAQ